MVWIGLASPKVEVFCWQLMRGRIATRDLIASRGMMDWNLAVCVFYEMEKELMSLILFMHFLVENLDALLFHLGAELGDA